MLCTPSRAWNKALLYTVLAKKEVLSMTYNTMYLFLCCVDIFKVVFKVAQKFGQRPCAIVVQGILSKMTRKEFSIFIIFSDTYTCSYVVYQVWADSDQDWIFYKFLNLLQNWADDPVL